MDSVTWKIGGEAGFGIMSSGIMLCRVFSRTGYHVFATNEYPSLIRGGHNVITVRIAISPFEAMNSDVHILVALNAETVAKHKDELNENALVVFDPADKNWQSADFPKPVKLIPVPLRELVGSLHADPIMRNTVTLGVTVALLGAPFENLSNVIADQFKHKTKEVIDQNIQIAQAGYDYIQKNYGNEQSMHLSPGTLKEKSLVLNASEAVGLGAVRAGLKFAAIYPMTPINALITFLADHAKSLGIVYKQPEDEIAGINMAIGAAVAGVRSMVATSGGGFALMVEGVSLAGMIEAPVVIDMGMRVGPATGMPTYTEQGDLQFIIHSGHGEFAKIVLAPGDAAEAYDLTIDAFNLADKYQTPVFVLTDKYINESNWCVPMPHFEKEVLIDRGKVAKLNDIPSEKSFNRYSLDTGDGVSPRSFPGQKGGQYFANSYEHDETGHATDHKDTRIAMAQKRLAKFQTMKADIKAPTLYGDPDAEISLVTWGSTKGPVLEALKTSSFKINNQTANLVHYTWLYPFPAEATKNLLAKAKRIIDIEQNGMGQLALLIREHAGIEITEKLLKFDGRPFFPEEILQKLTK